MSGAALPFLTALAWLVTAPLLVLLGWYALEVALGLWRTVVMPDARAPKRIAVLIPAHDEAAGIEATLAGLTPVPPGAEILVVADNCTDDTAARARRAGAEVTERDDPARRGKGYALAWGRDHLACRPPDRQPCVVVVLDGDCRTTWSAIARLTAVARALNRPAQARNLLVGGPHTPPLSQISNFAMLVKNLVRARGLLRLGGGITLFGTGMAFPWRLFAAAPLASGHLAEDLQLAVTFAGQGVGVTLVEDAGIESAPAPAAALAAQRRRWEGGFLSIARRQAMPLLLQGVRAGSRHAFALGMHLLVPPLAMLLLLAGAMLLLTTGLSVLGASAAPAFMLAVALSLALALTALAWLREGRGVLSLRAAAAAPAYVLWKVPLYLGLARRRGGQWVRTRREPEPGGPST
ncbi:glycosyltransferase [Erythrobacteraceae bacterium CFH 75059]|uniref:glycosyltransferase family 2 protein n=1 Tax=Qipengyuania thermophila TaxID=2509361 RepID=UPI00101F20D1|nr:glycosyltransferase family 2 protein [Qipengyuania thermophila]TCD04858.1 glycosyltransferase [Erythrobacteraceae bacterium CFH 75059]